METFSIALSRLQRRARALGRLAAAAALLIASTAVAQGEEDKQAARRFFDVANKAFAEGRFADAARAFEEAARLAPHPAPVINAGDAWMKAGEYARAARSFQSVLKMEGATEQDRVDATDRLARLQSKLGIIELVGADTLHARVDDLEFSGGERVYVFPGEHTVTLATVEGAKVRTLNITAGTARTVELDTLRPQTGVMSRDEPSAADAARDDGKDSSGGGISPLTWVAYGVGAAGFGTALMFGLKTSSAESGYKKAAREGDIDTAEKKRSDFDDSKLMTNVMLGIGLAGVAAGTTLLVLGLGNEDGDEHANGAGSSTGRPWATVGVAPFGRGGAIVTEGRF